MKLNGNVISMRLCCVTCRVKEHRGAMKRIKSADRKIEELSEELRRSKAERAAVANQIKLDVHTPSTHQLGNHECL